MPFFNFFLFQAVDCLLNRTRVSDVVEKGTRAPTVEDTGADTDLGPASERKPKAPLSPPPGASKASQNNDVDIIDNEETPGLFEDFVKVDSSVHDFEIRPRKEIRPRNAMLRVGLEHMLASGKIFKPLLSLLTVSKKVIEYLSMLLLLAPCSRITTRLSSMPSLFTKLF